MESRPRALLESRPDGPPQSAPKSWGRESLWKMKRTLAFVHRPPNPKDFNEWFGGVLAFLNQKWPRVNKSLKLTPTAAKMTIKSWLPHKLLLFFQKNLAYCFAPGMLLWVFDYSNKVININKTITFRGDGEGLWGSCFAQIWKLKIVLVFIFIVLSFKSLYIIL